MKRSVLSLIVLVIICTLFGIPTQQVRAASNLFAAVDGSGTSCLESLPCTLQTAAAQAASGDKIYVEEGTYTRSVAYDQVVTFGKTVTVEGSCIFDGNNGTLPVCGQPAPHRSIIDGELEHRCILIENHDQPTPPNVYLHHFNIQNGEADEVDLSDCDTLSEFAIGGCGGGIFIQDAGIVYINDFTFENNFAGMFLGTAQAGYGGAIYIQDTMDVTIINSTFNNNRATHTGQGFGGGVYATDITNDLIIQDSSFSYNKCTSTDSTVSKGCGAMVYTANDVYFQKNTFFSNNQDFASAINGSALHLRNNYNFTIIDNFFSFNKGNSVLSAENNTNLNKDIIAGNSFYDNDQSLKLIQYTGKFWVNIYNNFFNHIQTSTSRGGPAYTAIDLTSTYVSPLKSKANIYHNSISYADYGMNIGDNLILNLKNNIISWTNLMGINLPVSPTNMTTSFKTNLFYNNIGGDGIMDPSSVNKNPIFVNMHTDLHLQPTSWAIDRGIGGLGITTDIDGNLRPNSGYDIGADEAYGYFRLPLIFR